MRFSERYGYKPVREIIQKAGMDENLKNQLWNNIGLFIFRKYKNSSTLVRNHPISNSNLEVFFSLFYHGFLKKRIDQIPYSLDETIRQIEALFFKEWKWYEIYDFIEFCVDLFPFNNKDPFIKMLNSSLTEGNSAYRIINEKVVEITSEQEIQSIEEALKTTNPYSGIQQHLNQALQLMSDQQNPDYRNSIKESVSALEGLCQKILNKDKVTLGDAIGQIEKQFPIHPALKSSIKSLYGYTSDGDGIRHAMLEESNLTYIDAKFMLVACTNFINYLIEKTK
jgi:hypothetical protein